MHEQRGMHTAEEIRAEVDRLLNINHFDRVDVPLPEWVPLLGFVKGANWRMPPFGEPRHRTIIERAVYRVQRRWTYSRRSVPEEHLEAAGISSGDHGPRKGPHLEHALCCAKRGWWRITRLPGSASWRKGANWEAPCIISLNGTPQNSLHARYVMVRRYAANSLFA
jgi:hypothetical protein